MKWDNIRDCSELDNFAHICNHRVVDLSESFELEQGVRQGSCIGPMMFNDVQLLCLMLISNISKHSHAYADDHQICISLYPDYNTNTNKRRGGVVASRTFDPSVRIPAYP